MVLPLSSLPYDASNRTTVSFLVASSLVSLIALVALLGMIFFQHKRYTYNHTHFQAYFVCLLLANLMQAWGSVMSLRWLHLGGVYDGPFCAAQGGIAQGGNVGAAFWSFIICLHLFNLLVLRVRTTKAISWAIIALGWSFTFGVVFAGPVAFQTAEKGHYFGIYRSSCWITDGYRTEQIFLEFLPEYLALFVNLFLHILTALVVRGNLHRVDGRWRLRFVPRGEEWKLALARDYNDNATWRLANHMVLYPLAYAATIAPISFVRLAQFRSDHIPGWTEIIAGSFFYLVGLINVLLFFGTRRFFPEPGLTPEFEAKRGTVDKIVQETGVVPFTLQRPTSEMEVSEPERPLPVQYPARSSSRASIASTESFMSTNSQTPLRPSV